MSLIPHQHQVESIKKIEEGFAEGKNKTLLVLPSGSGKTHTIAFHVRDRQPKSFLYVVHRNEILIQTARIFQEICDINDEDIGIINSDFKLFEKKFVFATVQTLRHAANMVKMNQHIEYMCIDEFHHAAAATYREIIKYFKPKYFVGLTATPYRLDKEPILDIVDNNIAHHIDLYEGIERKILVPFHYIGFYDDIDYSKIKFKGFNYSVTDLDRKLVIHKRDEAVIREYKEKIQPEGRLTIGFCNSVAHVHRIESKFRAAGIKAIGISHREKYMTRERILEDFKAGKYEVLFTRDILNEGVDFPECSAIMFMRPTMSQVIFFQQLGRGLRKHPGKKDVLVFDFIGNYQRAFEKRDWFKHADVQEYSGFSKPIYEYNYPKPLVEFDKMVIQMMENQEYYIGKDVTKEMNLADYKYCCEMEGKPLSAKAYERSRYRKCSYRSIHNNWGSWVAFIQDNNLDDGSSRKAPVGFMACLDKDKLRENFYKVQRVWLDEGGKNRYFERATAPPTTILDNYKLSRYSSYCYRRAWGSYRNFLREIGELTDPHWDIKYNERETEITEIRIKLLIKALQKDLGREYFTDKEWRAKYGGLIKNKIQNWGGFNAFRKKFGVPEKLVATCIQCGKQYERSYSKAKGLCSDECRNRYKYENEIKPKKAERRAKRRLEKTNCIQCGVEMDKYHPDRPVVPRKYCSDLCQGRYYFQTIQKRKNEDILGRPIKFTKYHRSKDEMEELCYITIPQMIMLNPGIQHKNLRSIVGMDKQSFSKALKRLTDEGLIRLEEKNRKKYYHPITNV